mgnify:CR=1 FL=1
MKTPPLVTRFIDAVNRGDASAILEFFDPDTGVVVDAGRRFVGREEISHWNEQAFVGANGRLTPRKVQTDGQKVTIVGWWESNFYTGPTRFIFTLDGERIANLTMGQ